jgi:multidrug efflux pump subunit AcrA (membrane-fusion protein)
MDTEVDVPNPNLTLIPGMYAEVDLTLDHRAGALAIPVSAVDASAGDTVMVITPDQLIEIRKIRIGLQTANLVEVVYGLKEGDLVVIGNRASLEAGQKVQPKITVMPSSKE